MNYSGFTCINTVHQTCVKVVTSTLLNVVGCASGTIVTLPAILVDPTSTISPYSIFAPLIQINWQSTDLPGSGSSNSPTSSSTSSSSVASSLTSTPNQALTSASSLSKGATAGIAVGAVLIALVLGLLGAFIYQKQRNAFASIRQDSPQVYELHDGKRGPYVMSELAVGANISELPPGGGTGHGDSDGRVHELHT